MTFASLALFATHASALSLVDHEHTAWSGKDGLAGAVIWVSPVPNGMLLLRTSAGYQVFDGVQFHAYAQDKPAPFADPAGALGQRSPTGAIYYVHPDTQQLMRAWNGRNEIVEDPDGVARLNRRFVFDPQGIGWLPALGHMFRLEGLKVAIAGPSWGIPEDTALGNAVVDPSGTVWVATSEDPEGRLYYLPKGARKFESLADPVACQPIALAPDGTPWCASMSGLAMVVLDQGRAVGLRFLSKASHGRMAFDRDGGFWIASGGTLKHVPDWRQLLTPQGMTDLQADTFTVKDGLSSDAIWDIRADDDGNVWVGTGAGLDRFRATRFTPVKLPRRDFGSALLAEPDGSLLAGNWDRQLMRIRDGRIEDVPGVFNVTALRRDARGGLWVGGDEGAWHQNPGGPFVRHGSPQAPLLPSVFQIAEDDTGAVWFQAGHRLHRLQDGRWSKPEGPGTPPSNAFYAIVPDVHKQLWFISDQRVFVLKGGAFREITSPVYASSAQQTYVAHARGDRVWVGRENGVGVFQGEHFQPLKLKNEVARRITGIVETAAGDLWLHGLDRAYHLPADQVAAGLKGEPMTAEVFDFHDGLRAATSAIEPRPTLIEDAGGRLWFSTNRGLFQLDPGAKQSAPARPPQTLMRTVLIDGAPRPLADRVQVPPNPGHIEFGYAAAALGVSDRIRFRYRLTGVDQVWQEAGTRRTAYYTQLAPGQYQFEVMASNEQGEWADTPTSLAVDVQAAWYQTTGFRALVGLLALCALGALYLLRVQAVAARERARTREILAERARIARDLHDTLLQSVQGVILGCQAVVSELPAQHAARRSIEGQLDHADQLLGEARDRVRDLRTTGADAMPLREAFELAAAELEGGARIEVVEDGRPQHLRAPVRDDAYLIGREALFNAVMHARASTIEVRLIHGPRHFALHVRDDGIGIDPAVLASGSRPGHYGLPGMRERALQLGATLTVAPSAEGGTEVSLQVPAARAYEAARSPGRWRGLRRAWHGFGRRRP